MQNIIHFHDGEPESVNNTQGPLLLILHLTNMSHQCKVNYVEKLNQNRMYKARVLRVLFDNRYLHKRKF